MLELKEKLADLCHSQWGGWTKYQFGVGTFNDDGSWTMPPWAVERWRRQMLTPYKELSNEEQDTDRKEAAKFLEIFSQYNDGRIDNLEALLARCNKQIDTLGRLVWAAADAVKEMDAPPKELLALVEFQRQFEDANPLTRKRKPAAEQLKLLK